MFRSMTLGMFFVLVTSAPGRCQPPPNCAFGDDGFGIGCCLTAQPNLPVLPAIQIPGKQGCFLDCELEAEHAVNVTLSAPNFFACDFATIQVSAIGTGPDGPFYGGVMLAKYSRTWVEPGSLPGTTRQVWRFLVNGDLNTTLGIPITGCPTPLCALNTNGRVHFWGSLDYACEPGFTSPTFRVRMDLNHGPACLQHAPWTAFPGAHPAGAPERSYHIVAPRNFVFQPVAAPSGFAPSEAVRPTFVAPSQLVCLSEAPLATAASLTTVGQRCFCSPAAVSPTFPWADQELLGAVSCVGATNVFTSVPLPGTPFPSGFVTLGIGSWVPSPTGPVFPSPRDLCIHWGVVRYVDPCVSTPNPYGIVTGVTTSGHTGTLFGTTPQTYSTFLDLANHKNPATAFTVLGGTPLFGALAYADLVFNLNF